MRDPGFIRNRLKINADVHNARCVQSIRKEHGSFSDYLWSFVEGKPIVNSRQTLAELPIRTDESDAMSMALKKRGFKFAGTTICYAFMPYMAWHRASPNTHIAIQNILRIGSSFQSCIDH